MEVQPERATVAALVEHLLEVHRLQPACQASVLLVGGHGESLHEAAVSAMRAAGRGTHLTRIRVSVARHVA